MRTLTLKECTPGMRVVFIDRNLNLEGAWVDSDRKSVPLDGQEGVIVGFGDTPGKPVCVVLKKAHPLAHVCDGMAPDKRGVWARPEHLSTPESHAAHKAAHAEMKAQNAERDAKHAKALEIAKTYLAESGESE